jgi:hypothetical protein
MVQLHPDYELRFTAEIPPLFITTFLSVGFVWGNKPHWYQKTGFAGAVTLPNEDGCRPKGLRHDPYILQMQSGD